jgi:Mg2+ and Co2+ transporter CorA
LLSDLTEERRLLTELRNSVKEELTSAQIKNKEVVARVSHIAAEAEQEVRSGGNSLASGMEDIVTELSERFEKPLKELAKRQASASTLIRKMDTESDRISKIVNRGEKLIQFFDEKASYGDVIKEIEAKRYEDCRNLLVKGMPPSKVAAELGISQSEVDIISSLSS